MTLTLKRKVKCFFGNHQWYTNMDNTERICRYCERVEVVILVNNGIDKKWIKSSKEELDRRTAEEQKS